VWIVATPTISFGYRFMNYFPCKFLAQLGMATITLIGRIEFQQGDMLRGMGIVAL
jgi:hypothetical protein